MSCGRFGHGRGRLSDSEGDNTGGSRTPLRPPYVNPNPKTVYNDRFTDRIVYVFHPPSGTCASWSVPYSNGTHTLSPQFDHPTHSTGGATDGVSKSPVFDHPNHTNGGTADGKSASPAFDAPTFTTNVV